MAAVPIAFCITDLDVGGAERCLIELATRLDRERFWPVVYCLSPPPKPPVDILLSLLQEAQIEVHSLHARHAWQFPWVVRQLRRLLATQRPQLVQTFLFHANVVGRIAARQAGIPRVVAGLRVAEPRRWHLWLDCVTQPKVDRYVCVSRSVAEYAARAGRLPPEKLVVIPNGVDASRYPAAHPADLRAFGIVPDRRVVTFVGRLDRQKGVSWLIETVPTWMLQLPDCDLLLVGDGPLRAASERQCEQLGIADRVHFAGFRPDVPEILAASDLLVLPSIWEGMPNVVLEAMASGLPVVATAVEGVRELLGSAAEAQSVRFGDSQLITDKIVRLMQDRELATRIGAENRRRIESHFEISRMVEAYQDLWESLVAE